MKPDNETINTTNGINLKDKCIFYKTSSKNKYVYLLEYKVLLYPYSSSNQIMKKRKIFSSPEGASEFVHSYNSKMEAYHRECIDYHIEVIPFNLSWAEIEKNKEKIDKIEKPERVNS